MSQLFLFLDCNILLHYKFFVEIDWPAIAQANSIELVLPSNVINVLDQKKFDSSDSAVKDRARKVLARLEKISTDDRHYVRKDVTLCLLDQVPETDPVKLRLNPYSEDDRILAEILKYREIHPNRNVAVTTGDFGFRRRLGARQIPILQLSDDYLLADRPNSDQKRIKELELQLLELKNMQHKLNLTFFDGRNFIEINLRSARLLSEEEILSRIAMERDSLASSFAMDIINKRAMEVYLDEYHSFLRKRNEYKLVRSRMIELKFVLANDGSGSAEDTDVDIVIGRGIDVITEDHIGQPPKQPKLPTDRSRLPYPAAHDLVANIQGLTNPNLANMIPRNDSAPEVIATQGGSRIHFNVRRIKQTTRTILDPVYAPTGGQIFRYQI